MASQTIETVKSTQDWTNLFTIESSPKFTIYHYRKLRI